MSALKATLDYLYSLHTRGVKLGLDRVEAFLHEIHDPHLSYPSIHIAGTNGKGTTSTLIYRALQAQGLKTGIYTSPHILRFNERIVVNDGQIPDETICAFVDKHRAGFDKYHLTFFEITTAMAFEYFRDQRIEFAVIETGMGGRLDATNILVPRVSVITDISMDHSEFLGKRIVEIAGEKAGIIKPGVPLVFGIDNPKAREVIVRTALERKAPVIDTQRDYSAIVTEDSPEGMTLSVNIGNRNIDRIYLPLSGRHQVKNALMALGAIEKLDGTVGDDAIRAGFSKAKIPGRLDFRKGRPDTLFDVSHNVKGVFALNEHLERFFAGRKIIIVFGVMADKNYGRMFQLISGPGREVIVTQPNIERAKKADALVNEMGAGRAMNTVAVAVREARRMAGPDGLVVVAGSFYTVAEAFEAEVI